jgi:hypothetical protein
MPIAVDAGFDANGQGPDVMAIRDHMVKRINGTPLRGILVATSILRTFFRPRFILVFLRISPRESNTFPSTPAAFPRERREHARSVLLGA